MNIRLEALYVDLLDFLRNDILYIILSYNTAPFRLFSKLLLYYKKIFAAKIGERYRFCA